MVYGISYYFIFIIPLFFYYISKRLSKNLNKVNLLFVLLIFALFTGSRVEIGGDWGTYLKNYYILGKNFNLRDFNVRSDWGFEILSYFFYINKQPIFFLNLLISFFNFLCLYFFLRDKDYKWIFLIISVPFFVIVLQIGFIRQSVAISFIILSMLAIKKNYYLSFMICMILGMMFHKSSLLIFLIMILSIDRLLSVILKYSIFFIFIGIIIYLSRGDFGNLYSNYLINISTDSKGAIPRLILVCVPSIIYLLFYNKFNFSLFEKKFFLILSLLTFILIPLVISYSTLVDRLLIYLLPFQLVIYSSISSLSKNENIKKLINSSVISLFILYLFVWLNFSNSSQRWVPYSSFIKGDNISYNYNMQALLNCENFNNIYGYFDSFEYECQ